MVISLVRQHKARHGPLYEAKAAYFGCPTSQDATESLKTFSEDRQPWNTAPVWDAQRPEGTQTQKSSSNRSPTPTRTDVTGIPNPTEVNGLDHGTKQNPVLFRRTNLAEPSGGVSTDKDREPAERSTGGLQSPSKPITLIACHRNLLAVAYQDQVGLFFLRDPIGWHLVWLSPPLPAPIDRLALTSKAPHPVSLPTTAISSVTNSTGASVSPPVNFPNNPFTASTMTQSNSSQSSTVQVSGASVNPNTSFGVGSTLVTSSTVTTTSLSPVSSNPCTTAIHQPVLPTGLSLSVQPSNRNNAGCLVAATIGSTITLWCVNSPYGASTPVIPCAMGAGGAPSSSGGGVFGVGGFDASVASNKLYLCTLTRFSPDAAPGQPGHYSALPRAKQPWPSELRYLRTSGSARECGGFTSWQGFPAQSITHICGQRCAVSGVARHLIWQSFAEETNEPNISHGHIGNIAAAL
ncbi:unnamed protein product [Echinostoma caproni]|uniref:Uncharacterized protein n=1 Tax=Echinostoma caproni TaxID=27848 RepID=A0A183AER4_9TREM|nr:unnamed protein product [Echinostoma caproni]